MIDQLRKCLDANQEKYIQRLLDLVSIDTQVIGHGIEGGREAAGQEYLISLMAEMGADRIERDQMVEETVQAALSQHQEGNPGHNYKDRYNVYASFKGETSERSLLFNGHVDVMPPGNDADWETPPFKPEIRDGKIFGRGVCDMKGGLMAALMALQLLKDASIPLPFDVKIVSVCDEEGGGNGSIQAAMRGQKADGVIVCEPSDDKIIVALMGFIFFKVEVEGSAIHSGSKWFGVSAIEKAMKIIRAIEEQEHKWLMLYRHPYLPAPTSNVGVISGGTAGSTVADYCCFKTCVHYLPNAFDFGKMKKEYEGVIDRCCDGDEWLKDHRPKISIYQAGGAFEMETDHPFVESFQCAYRSVSGKNPEINGFPFGNDCRTWRNIAGCPTLQYGPGSMKECHTVNEFLSIESYLKAILVYAQMILEWGK